MTNNTSCKSLDEVANNLILKTFKSSLLYAFNGSGKTRLRQRCQKGRETTSAPFLQTVKARVKEET